MHVCCNTQVFQSTLPRRERPEGYNAQKQAVNISIHAPTKGATVPIDAFIVISEISIHAPTKGATQVNAFMIIWITDFNPRSHEGSDDSPESFKLRNPGFQSTLPRRERRWLYLLKGGYFYISIHAPTKGATL